MKGFYELLRQFYVDHGGAQRPLPNPQQMILGTSVAILHDVKERETLLFLNQVQGRVLHLVPPTDVLEDNLQGYLNYLALSGLVGKDLGRVGAIADEIDLRLTEVVAALLTKISDEGTDSPFPSKPPEPTLISEHLPDGTKLRLRHWPAVYSPLTKAAGVLESGFELDEDNLPKRERQELDSKRLHWFRDVLMHGVVYPDYLGSQAKQADGILSSQIFNYCSENCRGRRHKKLKYLEDLRDQARDSWEETRRKFCNCWNAWKSGGPPVHQQRGVSEMQGLNAVAYPDIWFHRDGQTVDIVLARSCQRDKKQLADAMNLHNIPNPNPPNQN